MHAAADNDALSAGQYVQQVARKFIGLYFRVLNDYPSYLFRFYGSDSTVVICEAKEEGPPVTTKAEDATSVQELLRTTYEENSISVRNCTPQPSSNGCISLLITGVMTLKAASKDRAFTQALILSRQSDGYYIKTDTVLVFPTTNWPAESSGLLSASMCTPETIVETPEAAMVHLGRMTPKETRCATNESKACIPPIDAKNGMSLLNTPCPGNMTKGMFDRVMNISDRSFAYDGRTRGFAMTAQEGPFLPMDPAILSTQGCPAMADGKSGMAAYSGALASPIAADPLAADLGRFHAQPWSHKSSPRTCLPNTVQRAPNEPNRLFACKLPLRSTVEAVTEVFSKFGTLAEEEPVRVFTGQNNCYACVTYESEQDMQKALDAEIRIGTSVVVTDTWRPRDRRPKRRRPENGLERAAIATAN